MLNGLMKVGENTYMPGTGIKPTHLGGIQSKLQWAILIILHRSPFSVQGNVIFTNF